MSFIENWAVEGELDRARDGRMLLVKERSDVGTR